MDNVLISDFPVEIQIDGAPPFVPEKVIVAGKVYGVKETTQPADTVRSFKPSSCYSTIHYVFNGLEVQEFYRRGEWVRGTNSVPRFCVSELLSFE